MPNRVFLVGHCLPDASYLSSVVRSAASGDAIIRINDQATLVAALLTGDSSSPDQNPGRTAGIDLLLVNRQLDGMFDTYSGVELIANLTRAHPAARMMLISNFPDAQDAARQAGAFPGFGKNDLRNGNAAQAITAALSVH